MNTRLSTLPLQTTAVYLLLATVWILLTDRLLHEAVTDATLYETFQTWKGLSFVLLSAAALYAFVRGRVRDIRHRDELRRSAEERLQSTETAYRLLFDNSGEAFLLTEPGGVIFAANPAACRMFGMSEREIREAGRNGLVDVDDPRLTAALEERRRTGRFSGELTFIRKGGGRFRGEVTTTLYTDDAGRERTSMNIRDITDRVEAQRLLHRSEERLRFALQTSGIGAWDLDLGDHTALRTPLHDAIFGYASLLPEWTYAVFLDHVVPEDREAVDSAFRRAIAERTDWNFECRIDRTDGARRWIWATGTHIVEPDGSSHRMAGIVQDITDRKRSEAELRASRDMLRNVLNSINDGFVAFDRDMNYTFVNPKAAELLGRSSAALVGRNYFREFPEAKGTPFADAYVRAQSTGVPEIFEDHFVPWDRWFENRIYPTAEGITVFFSEVTERKRSERILQRSQQQLSALTAHLQSSIEAERQRIARELHDDLGQTLTALRLDLSMLRRQSAEASGAAAEEVRAEIDAMLALIDDIVRSVRRIIRDLRPEVLDTLGIADALRWLAAEFTRRHHIPCALEIAALPDRIDQHRSTALFRIMQEALSNVARHADATSVTAALTLHENSIILSVTDDGRGIADEDRGKHASFGLLGIEERVKPYGGTLSILRADGGGTALTVRIPLQIDTA